MKLPFAFPPLEKGDVSPVWTGSGFLAQGQPVKVLRYSASTQGWTDALTAFHEATAGAAHPIDEASRALALAQLAKYLPGDSPVVLEIGCSSGFILRALRERFPAALIIGADGISDHLETLATALPTVPILQFDLLACPLPDVCVDAVVLLNVLEHIAQDAQALFQVQRILKPGGVLVLEVPAGPGLYDIYDRYLLHYRRYRLADLRQLALEAGFEILRQSHLGCFAYPLFALTKKRNRRFLQAQANEQTQRIAQNIRQTESSVLFRAIMKLELLIGAYVTYPFGIRCVMACRKPA